MGKFIEFHFASQDGAPPEPFTVRVSVVLLLTIEPDGSARVLFKRQGGETEIVLLDETYDEARDALFRVTQ